MSSLRDEFLLWDRGNTLREKGERGRVEGGVEGGRERGREGEKERRREGAEGESDES